MKCFSIQKHLVHLEKFPSIHLLDCQFKNIPHFMGAIHLYYIGGSMLRSTNFFTVMELSVVMCAMNLGISSISTLSKASINPQDSYRLSKLPHIESPGTLKEKNCFRLKNASETIDYDQMMIVARAFKQALWYLAHEDYSSEVLLPFLGTNFHNTNIDFDFVRFKTFAKDLAHNFYMSFSMAGIKNYFHNLVKFNKKDEKVYPFVAWNVNLGNIRNINDHVEKKIKSLIEYVKRWLFHVEERFQNFVYLMDIGIEIVPSSNDDSFLLKGFDAQRALDSLLKT